MWKLVKTQKQGGFTLIETIIYLALFSIMIVGLFISLFQIIYNTHDLERTSTAEEEINFAIRKMDYLMNDITDLSAGDVPDGPAGGDSVSFEKSNGQDVTISKDGEKIEVCMSSSSGCGDFITSQNVKVEDLAFTEIEAGLGSPIGIDTSMTINGRVIGLKKYLRI